MIPSRRLAVSLLVAAGMISAAPVQAQGAARPGAGDAAAARALVQRYYADVANVAGAGALETVVATDLVFHGMNASGQRRGSGALKAYLEELRRSFPDMRFETGMVIAEGDTAAAQFLFKGTHTGAPYRNLPAASRAVTFTGVQVFRVANGRIRELWVYGDTGQMLAQLPARPPGPPPSLAPGAEPEPTPMPTPTPGTRR